MQNMSGLILFKRYLCVCKFILKGKGLKEFLCTHYRVNDRSFILVAEVKCLKNSKHMGYRPEKCSKVRGQGHSKMKMETGTDMLLPPKLKMVDITTPLITRSLIQ